MTRPTPTTPLEVLRLARAKITDPKAWTKNKSARDSGGKAVSADSDKAVCWCSIGAIHAVCSDVKLRAQGYKLLALLVKEQDEEGIWNVMRLNDDPSTQHFQILAMFDKAIALAEVSP